MTKRQPDYQQSFRSVLKESRLRNDLTQEQVADLAGISRLTYTRIENGLKRASLELAFKLSGHLSFDLSDVVKVAHKLKKLPEYKRSELFESRERIKDLEGRLKKIVQLTKDERDE